MRDAPETTRTKDAVRFGWLSNSLGFLLRLSQLVSFRDFFGDLGELGVRPGEASVMMLIRLNPGIRQGVLARQLMIKPAHMAKMIRAMEDAGLVTRTVPDDDKRAMELWLSEAGVAEVEALRVPFFDHEQQPARKLTRSEDAQLKRLLRKYLGLPEEDAE